MRDKLRSACIALCSLLLMVMEAHADDTLLGTWKGELRISATVLRLELVIVPAAAGAGISAQLVSVDQQRKVVAATNLAMQDSVVTIKFSSINGLLVANKKGRNELTGRWQQNGLDLPITFSRAESKPDGAKTDGCNTEEFTIPSTDGSGMIAGVVHTPRADGSARPLIVLVNGSGQFDRDYVLLDIPVFRSISTELCRRGIGSLRFDDRGSGKTTASVVGLSPTVEGADLNLIVEWLLANRMGRFSELYLLGHSYGANLVSMTAVGRRQVAGLILVSFPAQTGLDTLAEQNINALRALGISIPQDATIKNTIATLLRDIASTEVTTASALRRLQNVLPPLSNDQVKSLNTAIQSSIEFIKRNVSWYRGYIDDDPMKRFELTDRPKLFVFGARDELAEAKQNILRIGVLSQNVESVVIGDMDHFLLAPSSEGSDRHVSRDLVPKVIDWIARVRPSAPK